MEMPFIKLSNTPILNLLQEQDPEFVFPPNGGTLHVAKTDIFKTKLHILYNNEKYEFNTYYTYNENHKIIPVGPKMWILKSEGSSNAVIYIVNSKLVLHTLFTFFHVVEKGVYYWNPEIFMSFFNFQTKKVSIVDLGLNFSVSFYNNYIFTQKAIYINTENLPKDLDLNICLQPPDLRIFPENKIKINFRDTSIISSISDLSIFESVFINDQLETQDEIFLDMEYSEFNTQNVKTLIYLKSGSLYRSLLVSKLKSV